MTMLAKEQPEAMSFLVKLCIFTACGVLFGSLMYASQEKCFKKQIFKIKFSSYFSEHNSCRPSLLGETPVQQIFKDYIKHEMKNFGLRKWTPSNGSIFPQNVKEFYFFLFITKITTKCQCVSFFG